MAYEKLFNEIYAAVSLKYLWQDYMPGFVKSEAPDWLNEAMELGLEVSQALLPDDGQTERFIEQYLGHRKKDLPESAFARYGERLYFYNDRFWAVLPDPELQQDYIYKAKYRFDRKLEKLNTNYQHRRYNGLYLFLHPSEETDINAKQLFEYMRQAQADKKVRFDWVFLNCENAIHVCNYVKNTLETIPLPRKAENFLNLESDRLRNGSEWKDGVSLEDAYHSCQANSEKF